MCWCRSSLSLLQTSCTLGGKKPPFKAPLPPGQGTSPQGGVLGITSSWPWTVASSPSTPRVRPPPCDAGATPCLPQQGTWACLCRPWPLQIRIQIRGATAQFFSQQVLWEIRRRADTQVLLRPDSRALSPRCPAAPGQHCQVLWSDAGMCKSLRWGPGGSWFVFSIFWRIRCRGDGAALVCTHPRPCMQTRPPVTGTASAGGWVSGGSVGKHKLWACFFESNSDLLCLQCVNHPGARSKAQSHHK